LVDRTDFVFVGHDFAVDFVNTRVCIRGTRVELLRDLEDVLAWLDRAGKGGLLADGIDALSPDERQAAFVRIMELRRRLEDAFAAVAGGGDVPADVVEYLNAQMAGAPGCSRLVRRGTGLALERRYRTAELPGLFAEEAARFLASMQPDCLKACENEACILYFYDTSRNKKRRWCSMDTCGNRVKASRHYHRRKAVRQAGEEREQQ